MGATTNILAALGAAKHLHGPRHVANLFFLPSNATDPAVSREQRSPAAGCYLPQQPSPKSCWLHPISFLPNRQLQPLGTPRDKASSSALA